MTDELIIDQESKPIPDKSKPTKEVPKTTYKAKEIPPTVNPENVITVDGESIEIKPTLLKYQRNRTAVFYRIIDAYPLADILSMEKGYIDPERDGDQALFDWCIAVTNDSKFVSKHFDSMDTGTIERMLSIFKRLNKIDEKEERAKNREAKMTTN